MAHYYKCHETIAAIDIQNYEIGKLRYLRKNDNSELSVWLDELRRVSIENNFYTPQKARERMLNGS